MNYLNIIYSLIRLGLFDMNQTSRFIIYNITSYKTVKTVKCITTNNYKPLFMMNKLDYNIFEMVFNN